MMKRVLICFLLIGLLLTGCGKNKQNPTMGDATAPDVTAEPTVQTEAPTTAPTEAPTEETIPGVEDSIFNEGDEVMTEATQPESTEPQATKPTGSTIPTKPSGSDEGIQEPDSPEPQEPTKPTEPDPTEPEPKPTEPQETTPPAPSEPSDYEKFQSMSPSEQQEHMNSFGSVDEFFDWYDQAKNEHDAANPPIEVGNGSVDLDEVLGK